MTLTGSGDFSTKVRINCGVSNPGMKIESAPALAYAFVRLIASFTSASVSFRPWKKMSVRAFINIFVFLLATVCFIVLILSQYSSVLHNAGLVALMSWSSIFIPAIPIESRRSAFLASSLRFSA